MNIVILDKETLGSDISLAPIYSLGSVAEYPSTSAEAIGERVSDAEVIVTNKIKLNGENLSAAKNLKLICVAATGYDNIDTEYCKRQGIALCNVPGYSTDSVAQLTLAMALSLATHLNEYQSFVNSGKYSSSGIANRLIPVYHELSTMTWGIVGGGNIGTRVAEAAKAIGSRVLVCRRKNEGDLPLADIDTICRECDIISLHLPLNENTRHIINRERIAAMKKGVILINAARGAVTDEEAVADAVLSGHIGGLGVDVYSAEPFGAEHPFCKLTGLANVCLTPHMGWGSFESRTRCIKKIAENIRIFLSGGIHNRIV